MVMHTTIVIVAVVLTALILSIASIPVTLLVRARATVATFRLVASASTSIPVTLLVRAWIAVGAVWHVALACIIFTPSV